MISVYLLLDCYSNKTSFYDLIAIADNGIWYPINSIG